MYTETKIMSKNQSIKPPKHTPPNKILQKINPNHPHLKTAIYIIRKIYRNCWNAIFTYQEKMKELRTFS